MSIDIGEVTAFVHHESKGILIVKVGFPKIGMWQNGWTVRKSAKFPEKGLWVQPPASLVGGRWRPVIEFDTQRELYGLIVDEVYRAADRWNTEKVITQDINEHSGEERENDNNDFYKGRSP